MIDVSTSPVEHRHEVIAHTMYAFLAQVCQRFLINLYLLVSVLTAIFYCLSYRERFYNTPFHAVALNILFQVANLLS